MTDKDKRLIKEVPLDISQEIDEKLILLNIAIESVDTDWIEELKNQLNKLVDIKKTLDHRMPRIERENEYYWGWE